MVGLVTSKSGDNNAVQDTDDSDDNTDIEPDHDAVENDGLVEIVNNSGSLSDDEKDYLD